MKKLNANASLKLINNTLQLKVLKYQLINKISDKLFIYELNSGVAFEMNDMINFYITLDEESNLLNIKLLTSTCFANNNEIVVRISSEIYFSADSIKNMYIFLHAEKKLNISLIESSILIEKN
jgi:hypothetical protein